MGIIVDLILVGLLFIFIFIGYKKGLTGSLFKLVSFALAIIIAVILYRPISNSIIKNTNIDNSIKNSIIKNFSNSNDNGKSATQDKVQNSIVNNINKEIESATVDAKETIVEQSAEKIAISIVNIGCAIAVFLIAKLILLIIGLFIKGITSLPIIKQIDKIGGIAYGIAEGVVIIYVILAIVSFANIVWANNITYQAVNKSVIGSMLYNNNVLLKFFL